MFLDILLLQAVDCCFSQCKRASSFENYTPNVLIAPSLPINREADVFLEKIGSRASTGSDVSAKTLGSLQEENNINSRKEPSTPDSQRSSSSSYKKSTAENSSPNLIEEVAKNPYCCPVAPDKSQYARPFGLLSWLYRPIAGVLKKIFTPTPSQWQIEMQEEFRKIDHLQQWLENQAEERRREAEDCKQREEMLARDIKKLKDTANANNPLRPAGFFHKALPKYPLTNVATQAIQQLVDFGITQEELINVYDDNCIPVLRARKTQPFDGTGGYKDCHMRSYRLLCYEREYGNALFEDPETVPLYVRNRFAWCWIQTHHFNKKEGSLETGGILFPHRELQLNNLSFKQELLKICALQKNRDVEIIYNCISFLLYIADRWEAFDKKEASAKPLEDIQWTRKDGVFNITPTIYTETIDQIMDEVKVKEINLGVLLTSIDLSKEVIHHSPLLVKENFDKNQKMIWIEMLAGNTLREHHEKIKEKLSSLELLPKILSIIAQQSDKTKGNISVDTKIESLKSIFDGLNILPLGVKTDKSLIQQFLNGVSKLPDEEMPLLGFYHIFYGDQDEAEIIQQEKRSIIERG